MAGNSIFSGGEGANPTGLQEPIGNYPQNAQPFLNALSKRNILKFMVDPDKLKIELTFDMSTNHVSMTSPQGNGVFPFIDKTA